MPDQRIPIVGPSAPPGYCFSTWTQLFIDIYRGAYAVIAGNIGTGFNFGQTIPGVDDTNKPWVRTNPDNSLEGIYTFAYGKWTRPHPIPAGPNDYRAIWVGPLAGAGGLWSFDGGDGQDPTIVPGANVIGSFWDQDTTFAARMLVGVGTLPLSGTILNVGDMGGLDEVTLSLPQTPTHTHQSIVPDQADAPNVIWGSSPAGAGGAGVIYPGGGGLGGPNANPIHTELDDAGGDPTTGVTEPHENMPPYVAVYVIKRTGRSHYAI
jgi:microcystin-dependent protein